MKALIVDDSGVTRQLLRGMLEVRGAMCSEAGDGCVGLEKLHSDGPFDLVLLDWNMPRMDGVEMLRRMRAQGMVGPRVVMISTHTENDDIVAALDAGADEYLMKPFDDEALAQKLALVGFPAE